MQLLGVLLRALLALSALRWACSNAGLGFRGSCSSKNQRDAATVKPRKLPPSQPPAALCDLPRTAAVLHPLAPKQLPGGLPATAHATAPWVIRSHASPCVRRR